MKAAVIPACLIIALLAMSFAPLADAEEPAFDITFEDEGDEEEIPETSNAYPILFVVLFVIGIGAAFFLNYKCKKE